MDTNNDVKDLMIVFSIARRELANDREQVKHLILLEERILKALEDESSRNEIDNGARG